MDIKRIQPAVVQNDLHLPRVRILVVDDEPSILFAYQRLLWAEGYHVDSCGELCSALNMVEKHVYFAIITDIRLSGSENSDGVSLLHSVRSKQPHARTIVVTGFGDADLETSVRELGATHYLEKPVTPSLIVELLRMSHKNDEELGIII